MRRRSKSLLTLAVLAVTFAVASAVLAYGGFAVPRDEGPQDWPGLWLMIGLGLAFLGSLYAAFIGCSPLQLPTLTLNRIRRDEGKRNSVQSRGLATAVREMRENLSRAMVSRNYLDKILRNMNEALFVTGPDGAIKLVNNAACQLLGANSSQLHGQTMESLLAEGAECGLPQGENQEACCIRSTLRCTDGRVIPVTLSMFGIENDDQGEDRVFIAHDISERLRNEREQRLAASVFANTTEGIMITDPSGAIVQVNTAFTLLTGQSAEQLVGRHPGFLPIRTPDGEDILALLKRLDNSRRWDGEIWLEAGSESKRWMWLNLTAIHDRRGQLDHIAAVFTDLSALKEAENRIHHLAYYDNLTGLPNRTLFQERLQHALDHAQSTEKLVALLFLDLDRFKVINDSKGHAVGDRLLMQVAKRLAEALREGDTVSRLGGDEFAILLPELNHPDEAAVAAQKILADFVDPFWVDGQEFYTGASVGISVYPLDATAPDCLLSNSDAAMYRAKEHGSNGYQFFTPDMNDRVAERMEFEHGLRQALQRNEFELHYQPQIDLATGSIIGMEALLRWQHDQLGQVPPAMFIPVAEDTGLIIDIGKWVLRAACRQNRVWQKEGLPPLRVAVNLSVRQFQDPQLLQHVQEVLSDTGMEPSLLELELTESVVMEDLERSIATLMQLNELGVRIALDDFGTGYSSLSYLKRFPIHVLKIDRSFIRDITSDPEDAAIVGAIITMGHSLGLQIVAEGVETPEHGAFLRQHHCDLAQGYYYSRPLPSDRFTRLIEDTRSIVAGFS